ncbi:DUF2637 domain-containing protein [Nocardia mexicana]|nr:DUF2637 domain-containing protein [Nocardia mexicana]
MFFWCVLAASAAVSVTGNAVHATFNTPAAPIAAAVAVVPPIALLTAVHGVTVLLRTQTRATAIHLLAMGLTVLIAAGAFWLSFTALRDLAELAGIPHQQAWLWPLIIEGSMTQATIALIALARNQFHHTTDDTAAPDATTVSPPPEHLSDSPTEGDHSSAPAQARYDQGTHHWSEVATAICEADPARRRDPGQIAHILKLHYADGLNPTEIACRTQRSRSTISRIIARATELETGCAEDGLVPSKSGGPQ